jgi:hypothetical protein
LLVTTTTEPFRQLKVIHRTPTRPDSSDPGFFMGCAVTAQKSTSENILFEGPRWLWRRLSVIDDDLSGTMGRRSWMSLVQFVSPAALVVEHTDAASRTQGM